MRTLDTKYLSENPTGEKSVVTLQIEIPEAVHIALSPDGTRPVVTLEATGDKHQHVLAALNDIHDDERLGQITHGMVAMHFDLDDDATPDEIGQLAQTLETPFPEHIFDLHLVMDSGAEVSVEIKVTAPSVQTAVMAMRVMTGQRALMNVAISLCPEFDDEWGDRNEVLVRN